MNMSNAKHLDNMEKTFILIENKEIIDHATSDEVFDREDAKVLTYDDKVCIAYYSLVNYYVKGHCWNNKKGRNIDSDGISKAICNFIATSDAHEHIKEDVVKIFLDGLKND